MVNYKTIFAVFGAILLFALDGFEILKIVDTVDETLGRLGKETPQDNRAASASDTSTASKEGSEAAPGGGTKAPPAYRYVWSYLDSKGDQRVRAILPPGSECPKLTFASKSLSMTRRSPRSTAQFPATVCEGHGPLVDVAYVTASHRFTPLAPAQSIIVLGDTGCRLVPWQQQGCNDVGKWPFNAIAREAAKRNPDLIIHLGDYHYREAPCPDTQGACAGADWGYDWEAWRQDFFEPAKPLLDKAPWVFVRGNHEDCGRAWAGWFHLLSPTDGASNGSCLQLSPGYDLKLEPSLDIAVLDTADRDQTNQIFDKNTTLKKWQTQTENVLNEVRMRAQDDPNRLRLTLMHQPLFLYTSPPVAAPIMPDPLVGLAEHPNKAEILEGASALCSGKRTPDGVDLSKMKPGFGWNERGLSVTQVSVDGLMEPLACEELIGSYPRTGRVAIEALFDRLGGVGGATGRYHVFSGDSHSFQSLYPADAFWYGAEALAQTDGAKFPAMHQITVGNSGTALDQAKLEEFEKSAILESVPAKTNIQTFDSNSKGDDLSFNARQARYFDGQTQEAEGPIEIVRHMAGTHRFGYMHMEHVKNAGYRAGVFNVEGQRIAACAIAPNDEAAAKIWGEIVKRFDLTAEKLEPVGVLSVNDEQDGLARQLVGRGCIVLPTAPR
jgi:hypothetical protein